jgi:hypothetical protein
MAAQAVWAWTEHPLFHVLKSQTRHFPGMYPISPDEWCSINLLRLFDKIIKDE